MIINSSASYVREHHNPFLRSPFFRASPTRPLRLVPSPRRCGPLQLGWRGGISAALPAPALPACGLLVWIRDLYLVLPLLFNLGGRVGEALIETTTNQNNSAYIMVSIRPAKSVRDYSTIGLIASVINRVTRYL